MNQFFTNVLLAATEAGKSPVPTNSAGFMIGPIIQEGLSKISPNLGNNLSAICWIADFLLVFGLIAAVCALVFGILKQKIEELAANDETVSPEEIKKRKKKNETRFKASLTIAIVLVALPSLLAIIFGAISAN